MNFGLLRMAITNFAQKSPHDRALAAQQLAADVTAAGVRDAVAAIAPADVVDAMYRFLLSLRDWRG
jgi:hypothetical protein